MWFEGLLGVLAVLSAFTYVLRTDPSLPLFLAMFVLWHRNEAQRYRLSVLLLAFTVYDVLWVLFWFLYGHNPDIFASGSSWLVVVPVYVAMAGLAGKLLLFGLALCPENATRNFFGLRLSLFLTQQIKE